MGFLRVAQKFHGRFKRVQKPKVIEKLLNSSSQALGRTNTPLKQGVNESVSVFLNQVDGFGDRSITSASQFQRPEPSISVLTVRTFLQTTLMEEVVIRMALVRRLSKPSPVWTSTTFHTR